MVRHNVLLGILSLCLVIGATAKSTQAATIPAGATGHYALNGDATDSSGNGAHGTGVTDVTYSFDATRGKQVANFNGSSSEINVGASGNELSSQDLGPAGASPEDILAFTVGYWAKFNNPGDINVVMGTFDGAAGRVTVELVGNGSWGGFGAHGGIGVVGGPSAADAWKHNDTANGGAGAINLFDGQWHHIVMAWQDPDTGTTNDPNNHNSLRGPMMVWIDNILADTHTKADYGGAERGNVDLFLGKALSSNINLSYLDGSLSDVTFYDRKLTAAEVSDLHAATAIPEPSSIVLALLSLVGLVGYAIRRKK